MASNSYANIGLVYYRLNNYHKAIDYYNKALEIKKSIGDRGGESVCYENIGLVYIELYKQEKKIIIIFKLTKKL